MLVCRYSLRELQKPCGFETPLCVYLDYSNSARNTFIIINLHDSVRSEVKRGVIVRMVSRGQRDANLKRIRRAETLAPLDRSRRPFRNLDSDVVHLRVCRFRERGLCL